MTESIEAFEGYVLPLALVVIALLFRSPVSRLIATIGDRVRSGAPLRLTRGETSLEIGGLIRNTEEAKVQGQLHGESIQVYGDPDQLKLLFKVKGERWKKSTKALELPEGCLVQVTTERQGLDGSWTTAEALEYVPGVRVVADVAGGYVLGSR
jgi:hypothetical protein